MSKEKPNKKSWPTAVETKVEMGVGFFKNNSAEKIAAEVKKKHGGDIKKSISALNFAINRNKNQSEEIKTKIRKAISILKKEASTSKEAFGADWSPSNEMVGKEIIIKGVMLKGGGFSFESATSELDGVDVEIQNSQPESISKPTEPEVLNNQRAEADKLQQQQTSAVGDDGVVSELNPNDAASDANAINLNAGDDGIIDEPENPEGGDPTGNEPPIEEPEPAENTDGADLGDGSTIVTNSEGGIDDAAQTQTLPASEATAERFVWALESTLEEIEAVTPGFVSNNVEDVDMNADGETLEDVLGDPLKTHSDELEEDLEEDADEDLENSEQQAVGTDDGVNVALSSEIDNETSNENDSENTVDENQSALDVVENSEQAMSEVDNVPYSVSEVEEKVTPLCENVDIPTEKTIATSERFFVSLECCISELENDCDDCDEDEEECDDEHDVEEYDEDEDGNIYIEDDENMSLESANPDAGSGDKKGYFTEQVISQRIEAFIKSNGDKFNTDIDVGTKGTSKKIHVGVIWVPKKAKSKDTTMLAIANDGKGKPYFAMIGTGGIYTAGVKGRLCGFNSFLSGLKKSKKNKSSSESSNGIIDEMDELLRAAESGELLMDPHSNEILPVSTKEDIESNIDDEVGNFLGEPVNKETITKDQFIDSLNTATESLIDPFEFILGSNDSLTKIRSTESAIDIIGGERSFESLRLEYSDISRSSEGIMDTFRSFVTNVSTWLKRLISFLGNLIKKISFWIRNSKTDTITNFVDQNMKRTQRIKSGMKMSLPGRVNVRNIETFFGNIMPELINIDQATTLQELQEKMDNIGFTTKDEIRDYFYDDPNFSDKEVQSWLTPELRDLVVRVSAVSMKRAMDNISVIEKQSKILLSRLQSAREEDYTVLNQARLMVSKQTGANMNGVIEFMKIRNLVYKVLRQALVGVGIEDFRNCYDIDKEGWLNVVGKVEVGPSSDTDKYMLDEHNKYKLDTLEVEEGYEEAWSEDNEQDLYRHIKDHLIPNKFNYGFMSLSEIVANALAGRLYSVKVDGVDIFITNSRMFYATGGSIATLYTLKGRDRGKNTLSGNMDPDRWDTLPAGFIYLHESITKGSLSSFREGIVGHECGHFHHRHTAGRNDHDEMQADEYSASMYGDNIYRGLQKINRIKGGGDEEIERRLTNLDAKFAFDGIGGNAVRKATPT